MGYPVCPNRIHSSGINGPRKSLFEITKSFFGEGHCLKLFFGVWESGAQCTAHERGVANAVKVGQNNFF